MSTRLTQSRDRRFSVGNSKYSMQNTKKNIHFCCFSLTVLEKNDLAARFILFFFFQYTISSCASQMCFELFNHFSPSSIKNIYLEPHKQIERKSIFDKNSFGRRHHEYDYQKLFSCTTFQPFYFTAVCKNIELRSDSGPEILSVSRAA